VPWLLLILPVEGVIAWRIWVTSRAVNKAAGEVKTTIVAESEKMRTDFLNAVGVGLAAFHAQQQTKDEGGSDGAGA